MLRLCKTLLLVFISLFITRDVNAINGIGPSLITSAPSGLPLSGMTLWLNGRAGLVFGTNTTWQDQSAAQLYGGTWKALAANATTVTINGKQAVKFRGGAGTSMTSTGATPFISGFLNASSPHLWTMAAVFQVLGAAGRGVDLPSSLAISNFPMLFGGGTTEEEVVGIGACKSNVTLADIQVAAFQYDSAQRLAFIGPTTSPSFANPHYVLGWYDGTNLNVSVDGGSVTTAAASAYTDLNGESQVGGGDGSSSQIFNGAIGEVTVWNRVLTSTEQSQVQSFFTTNWGTLGP